MLYQEALWVGDVLLKHLSKGQSVINIGSSGLLSRSVLQPHMNECIFNPLEHSGIRVVHTDIRKEEGVDLVGDLTDPGFIAQLVNEKVDMVMCCNLLEHLLDREPIISALQKITPPGGYLLLTVPFHYPYHLDPIDTMYRPNVEELSSLFNQLSRVEGKVLTSQRRVYVNGSYVAEKNYFSQLIKNPGLFLKLLLRCMLPFYKPRMWWITLRDLIFMFRSFKVTCVLLRKEL